MTYKLTCPHCKLVEVMEDDWKPDKDAWFHCDACLLDGEIHLMKLERKNRSIDIKDLTVVRALGAMDGDKSPDNTSEPGEPAD